MSTVLVVAPMVIGQWPAIAAAIASACTALGYTTATALIEAPTHSASDVVQRVWSDAEVASDVGHAAPMMVAESKRVRAEFSVSSTGQLKICVAGPGLSRSELERLADQLQARVTQQYVYHRLLTELARQGAVVVDQETLADGSVRIQVKSPL